MHKINTNDKWKSYIAVWISFHGSPPHSMIREYLGEWYAYKNVISEIGYSCGSHVETYSETWWAFIGNGICSARFGVQWIVLCFCFVKLQNFDYSYYCIRTCLIVLQEECIESSQGFTYNGWQCSMPGILHWKLCYFDSISWLFFSFYEQTHMYIK